jgi:plasmid stabilization system protein ParE
MRFTVIWLPKAEERLTEIWLAAADQAAVSAASDDIDRLLMVNPLGVGEPRTAKIRYLYQMPLAVYYEVVPADRLVRVRSVWRPPTSA